MTPTRVIQRMPTANARAAGAKLWHDESVLRKLYEQDGQTQRQIADQLGCSLLTINKAFKKFGIQCKRGRRPRSSTKGSAARSSTRSTAPSKPRTPKVQLDPEKARSRLLELMEIMEKLGPHARAAVKKDLHDLVDCL